MDGRLRPEGKDTKENEKNEGRTGKERDGRGIGEHRIGKEGNGNKGREGTRDGRQTGRHLHSLISSLILPSRTSNINSTIHRYPFLPSFLPLLPSNLPLNINVFLSFPLFSPSLSSLFFLLAARWPMAS